MTGISAVGIKELASQKLLFGLVDIAQQIGIWVFQCMRKKNSKEAFISNMTDPENQKLVKDLLDA